MKGTKEKGITLIALVITIVVLIILAGVSMSLVIGENGLFNKAKSGAEQYQMEAIKEKLESEILTLSMEKVAKGENLTVAEVLLKLQSEGICIDIDIENKKCIYGNYTVEFSDENGNVSVKDIQEGKNVEVKTKREFKQIETGENHSLAIDTDGNLWIWGYNSVGQLGDGTAENRTEPVQVTIDSKPDAKFTQIAAGSHHSLAIDTEGNLWAWGYNSDGQLGDGTKEDKNKPIQVTIESKPNAKFTQIAAGRSHSLAVDTEGNLWAWGSNDAGRLGNGTTVQQTKPVQITGIQGSIKQIEAGFHSLALDEDGNLWGWGHNFYGELGNGTTENNVLTPQKITVKSNESIKFSKIAAGMTCTFAIDTDGNLWATGQNQNGQIGNEATEQKNELVQITVPSNPNIKFETVESNTMHTIVLDKNGDLWSCGLNEYGQLGDGTNIQRLTLVPVTIPANPSIKFTQIAVGREHSMALDTENHLWTWGWNTVGQLGNGTTVDVWRPSPIY